MALLTVLFGQGEPKVDLRGNASRTGDTPRFEAFCSETNCSTRVNSEFFEVGPGLINESQLINEIVTVSQPGVSNLVRKVSDH